MLASVALALAQALAAEPLPQQKPHAAGVGPSPHVREARPLFSYTFAQIDAVFGDGDGYDSGPDGFDLLGSYELEQKGLCVFGGLSHLSGDVGNSSPDTDKLTLGLGFHKPIEPSTDLVVGLSLMHAHTQTNATSGAANGNGYGLEVGLRHMSTEDLELDGSIGYSNFDDSSSQTTLRVGLIYSVSPKIGFCGNLSTSSDLNALTLGLRYTP